MFLHTAHAHPFPGAVPLLLSQASICKSQQPNMPGLPALGRARLQCVEPSHTHPRSSEGVNSGFL